MRILMLIVVATVCAFGNADATNYFLSPTGNDSNAGSYSGPWASLQHAGGILVAGDTLFVLGGSYTNEQTIISLNNGTTLHPIVIKAYGDLVADFQNSSSSRPRFLDTTTRIYHIVIDGESHLNPSSTTRFLKFTGTCDNMAVIMASTGFIMRGTEWDGTNSSLGEANCWMFQMASADSFLIENNYLHDGGHSPCDNPPDCTGDVQGSGDCLYMWGCSYGIIRNNTFKRGAHDLVKIQSLRWSPYTSSQYILIQNNLFDNGWGGCLYISMSTNWCLVENNVYSSCGRNDYIPKTRMQISGNHNSVRKNVFYCPSTRQ